MPLVPIPAIRRQRRCLFLALACWAAGQASSGQTQPVPLLPLQPTPPLSQPTSPSPASEPAGTPDAVPPPIVSRPTRNPPWDYSLGIGAWWQSNVAFDASKVPSDLSASARAMVSRRFEGSQSHLTVALGGSGYLYPDASQYSRLDGEAALEGQWRVSSRASGSIQGSCVYGHTDNAGILTDQGVLLPLARTLSYSATAELTTQTTANTNLRLSGRFYRVAFGDPLAAPTVTPTDSDSVRGYVSFDGRLSQQNQVSLQYAFERALNEIRTDSHYGFLGWTHTFSPRTAVLVDAGASYTLHAGDVGLQQPWNFYGGLSLNRQVKRSSLKAYYRREVIPVFGFAGVRLTDRLGLDASIPMGRDWNLTLTGEYVVGPKSELDSSRPTTGESGLSLAWRAGRHVGLAVDGRYRRRSGTPTVQEVSDFAAGVVVSLVSGQASAIGGTAYPTRH